MDDQTATLKILSLFLVIVSIGAVATCLLTSWNLLRRKILVLTLLLGTLVIINYQTHLIMTRIVSLQSKGIIYNRRSHYFRCRHTRTR
jgi:hypothetical protein